MISILLNLEQQHPFIMARIYLVLGFTFMSINYTLFKHSEASIYQIMYERGLILITFNVLIHPSEYYPKIQLKFLLLQGIAFAISSPFFFIGIRSIPLAEAVIISQTNTIWSQFIALLLLKESIHSFRFVYIGLSIIGILFITKPSLQFEQSQQHLIGCLMTWIASIFQALSFVGIKLVGSSINPIIINQYFQIPLVLLCSICRMYYPYTSIYDWQYFMHLLGILFATFMYTTLQYRSMSLVSYAKLAPFSFITVLNSVIIGYFVFQNIPDTLTIIGGCIVLISMGLSMKY